MTTSEDDVDKDDDEYDDDDVIEKAPKPSDSTSH